MLVALADGVDVPFVPDAAELAALSTGGSNLSAMIEEAEAEPAVEAETFVVFETTGDVATEALGAGAGEGAAVEGGAAVGALLSAPAVALKAAIACIGLDGR